MTYLPSYVTLFVALLLVSPLCVVPTELTDHTEAYGLKVLESTERIDAVRHTTEGKELIACVASPRLSMVRRLWRRKRSFLWILVSRSVDHSVDSKSLSP